MFDFEVAPPSGGLAAASQRVPKPALAGFGARGARLAALADLIVNRRS